MDPHSPQTPNPISSRLANKSLKEIGPGWKSAPMALWVALGGLRNSKGIPKTMRRHPKPKLVLENIPQTVGNPDYFAPDLFSKGIRNSIHFTIYGVLVTGMGMNFFLFVFHVCALWCSFLVGMFTNEGGVCFFSIFSLCMTFDYLPVAQLYGDNILQASVLVDVKSDLHWP